MDEPVRPPLEPPQQFSVLEAEKIFEVALALKQRADQDAGAGLTRAQIEEIGGDVGLSPDEVRQAMAVIATEGTRTGWFVGSPSRLVLERDLTIGVSPDDETLLLDLLRQRTGVAGVVEQVAGTTTWTAQQSHHLVRATIVRSGGKVRLRLEQQHRAYATALFLLLVGGGSTLAAVTALDAARNGMPLALVAIPLVALATWGWARKLLRDRVARDQRRLEALFRDLLALTAPSPG
jgi:hypothetical protein